MRSARRNLSRPGDLQLHEFDISGVPGFNDVQPSGQDHRSRHLQHLPQHPERGRPLGHPDDGYRDGEEANCNPAVAVLTVTEQGDDATRRICDLGRGGNGVWTELAQLPRAAAARPRRPGAGSSTTARRRTSSRRSSTTRSASTSTCRTASGRTSRPSWARSSRSARPCSPTPSLLYPGSGGVLFGRPVRPVSSERRRVQK